MSARRDSATGSLLLVIAIVAAGVYFLGWRPSMNAHAGADGFGATVRFR